MIVAVSGACHSGKTTLITRLKEISPEYVTVMSEVIREVDIDIDEIRKDPYEYLQFQKTMIGRKISQELRAAYQQQTKRNYHTKIYLIDRSLVDSYYYLTRYMNFDKMDEKIFREYEEFRQIVLMTAQTHMKTIYDGIILLRAIPYPAIENDKYRPTSLRYQQSAEFDYIKYLTYGIIGEENDNLFYSKIMECTGEDIIRPLELYTRFNTQVD